MGQGLRATRWGCPRVGHTPAEAHFAGGDRARNTPLGVAARAVHPAGGDRAWNTSLGVAAHATHPTGGERARNTPAGGVCGGGCSAQNHPAGGGSYAHTPPWGVSQPYRLQSGSPGVFFSPFDRPLTCVRRPFAAV
ncbi:hypothetical protein Taro_016851 [Colocasia esculenta]|uniref:Uncharacterized protein n=1 Tax=Colocasia esculenta TaxID=4460 RepID=A0A843UPN2_COLES|nr:hypothetical protein [Colocasia esculenta]